MNVDDYGCNYPQLGLQAPETMEQVLRESESVLDRVPMET